MTEEIADWVFEGVLQFLRSPLWTAPVHGFIEQHCHEFVAGEEENKLEYTTLHNEFRTLVDDLLTSFLEQLGVSGEDFLNAVKSGANVELSALVLEFLYALDDFASFRALMEKRNIELELEAMYEYARYSAADADEMTDEERFLYELAVKLSLGANDISMKEAEREDAELLQALAMSIAMEQERQVYMQLLAEQAAAEGGAPPPATVDTEDTIGKIQEDVQRQRVANMERALTQPATEMVPPPPPSATVEPNKALEKVLAPLGERRAQTFGAKRSVLPEIRHSDAPPTTTAPSTPPPPQPSFTEVRGEVEKRLGVSPAKAGPTEEELAQRAAYFKAQRERLVAQKQKERQTELELFQQQQGGSAPAPTASAPVVVAKPANETDATREMRLALARRFKEDLVQESRKAAPQ